MELLKDYDCTIDYHPGKANVVADSLNRKSTGSLAYMQTIPLVKVLWRNHLVEEATWEREDQMRSQYPLLFHDTGTNFVDEIFL